MPETLPEFWSLQQKLDTLEYIRKTRGLSPEKMARKLGISFMTYYRWMRGKHLPSKLAMRRIDNYLKRYIKGRGL